MSTPLKNQLLRFALQATSAIHSVSPFWLLNDKDAYGHLFATSAITVDDLLKNPEGDSLFIEACQSLQADRIRYLLLAIEEKDRRSLAEAKHTALVTMVNALLDNASTSDRTFYTAVNAEFTALNMRAYFEAMRMADDEEPAAEKPEHQAFYTKLALHYNKGEAGQALLGLMVAQGWVNVDTKLTLSVRELFPALPGAAAVVNKREEETAARAADIPSSCTPS